MKIIETQKLAQFEEKLSATVEEMSKRAAETLEAASAVGPQLSDHLSTHARSELSLDDVETASRVWERLLMTSRKVLKLDEPEQGNASLRVGIMVHVDRPGAVPASAPVIDVPSAEQGS